LTACSGSRAARPSGRYRSSSASPPTAGRRRSCWGACAPADSADIEKKTSAVFSGTRFKIVTGYPGGNDIYLAKERGEVGGRGSNSWKSWKSTRPQWLREKLIHVLVQIGLKRHPELPDVPLMLELGRSEDDRNVLAFISADTEISRPIVTTPDTSRERVAALRRAFDATMKDSEFLAEAQASLMDITPEGGEEAQKIAAAIVDTPAGIVGRAKALLESK
jgi:hypothetical protein